MGAGKFKLWDVCLTKAAWLVNARESANQDGPAQSKLLCTVEGDKVPVGHITNTLGKTVCIIPSLAKANPFVGLHQVHSRTWVHLVGDAGGWGSLMRTSRGFDFG